MITCWCHIADSLSASARATMSVGPPAATGTMTRTGLLGYVPFGVCARPAPRRRLVVTTWAAESAIKSRQPSISVNPRCLDTRILSLGQRGHHRRMAEGMHMRACVVQTARQILRTKCRDGSLADIEALSLDV